MKFNSTRCSCKKNKAILLQIPIEFVQNYLPDVEQYVFAVNDKMDNDEKR